MYNNNWLINNNKIEHRRTYVFVIDRFRHETDDNDDNEDDSKKQNSKVKIVDVL